MGWNKQPPIFPPCLIRYTGAPINSSFPPPQSSSCQRQGPRAPGPASRRPSVRLSVRGRHLQPRKNSAAQASRARRLQNSQQSSKGAGPGSRSGRGLAGRPPRGWCRSGDVVLISRGHDDVHPNPHGLGAGCHHVEKALIGFDAEGQPRVGALGEVVEWSG